MVGWHVVQLEVVWVRVGFKLSAGVGVMLKVEEIDFEGVSTVVLLIPTPGATEVDSKSESFQRITKCSAKICVGAVLAGVRIGQESVSTVLAL